MRTYNWTRLIETCETFYAYIHEKYMRYITYFTQPLCQWELTIEVVLWMFMFLTSEIKMTSTTSCLKMAGIINCRLVDLPLKLEILDGMFRKHIHLEILKFGPG